MAAVEDDVRWQTDVEGAPLSRGQAGTRFMPLGAAIGAAGGWILGAGIMTAAASARSLARPDDAAGSASSDFDYRYAGIAGAYRRDTLTIAAARRIGDSLALGLALGASQVRVTEHRRIWAGLTVPVADSKNDVDLLLTGIDRFAETAVAGLLFAPEGSHIELGASVAWANTVKLTGTVDAKGSPPIGPSVVELSTPEASLEIRQPFTLRAGGRYVGDRLVAELGGDLWIAPPAAETAVWSVRGVSIVDPSQVSSDLQQVPSRISQHTHAALRFAVDFELVPGFLWATAGYALSTPGTSASRLSPSFGDLGGHTLGLGLETTAGGFTVTLGWSRTWSPATSAPTALSLDNPFRSVMAPDTTVYEGGYDGSLDQVGILVEVELGHPPPH
jgi:hypothetical protein